MMTDLKLRWAYDPRYGYEYPPDVFVLQTPTLDVYLATLKVSSYVVVQEHRKEGRKYNYTFVRVANDGSLMPNDDDVTPTPHDMCLIHEYHASQKKEAAP